LTAETWKETDRVPFPYKGIYPACQNGMSKYVLLSNILKIKRTDKSYFRQKPTDKLK
jgi:hypothetical protein